MSGRSLIREVRRRIGRLLIRNDAIRLGRRIRSAREARGVSIAELARRTGLDEASLRRWEAGDMTEFDSFALELAGRALRRTRSWLLAGEAEPPPLSDEFGARLCEERIVALIAHFEAIASPATRRRLARYLLFVSLTGQRAKAPKHLRHREDPPPTG